LQEDLSKQTKLSGAPLKPQEARPGENQNAKYLPIRQIGGYLKWH
jgi:hypothetical protein